LNGKATPKLYSVVLDIKTRILAEFGKLDANKMLSFLVEIQKPIENCILAALGQVDQASALKLFVKCMDKLPYSP
jgi:hypothetical protein